MFVNAFRNRKNFSYMGIKFYFFIFIFLKIFFIYLFMTERERDRDTGRGRSRLHAGSLTWDSILGLQDHALGGRQALKPLSHPGCPISLCFYEALLSVTARDSRCIL